LSGRRNINHDYYEDNNNNMSNDGGRGGARGVVDGDRGGARVRKGGGDPQLDRIDILYWMNAPRIGALGGGFK